MLLVETLYEDANMRECSRGSLKEALYMLFMTYIDASTLNC